MVCEHNRVRTANRYLKRIIYGNRIPNRTLIDGEWIVFDPSDISKISDNGKVDGIQATSL
jgi:hypothetical protein